MSYSENIEKLSPTEFNQVVGVKRETFNEMLKIVEHDYQTIHTRRGRNSKLSIKDKLLITLQYYREYPTMLSLAVHYGVSETTIRTVIHHTEQLLVRSRQFKLPGKKRLLEANNDMDFIIIDGTDSPIQRPQKNKKKLDRSIEERDPAIAKRLEFGHWECDLVLGNKTKDDEVLLTFYERMTRIFFIIKIKDKTAASVMATLENLRQEYGEHWNEIFKTITTDNGSEFADLSQLEQISETLVYFAHPYTSCDKGGVECHNRLIRRFIPQGQAIKKWTFTQISEIQEWCNGLPRKILAYHTPEELFDRELDRIYQVSA